MTIAIIANITAPSRPKRNQPIKNATTAPNPIAPQFTDTIFLHLLFKILFFHLAPVPNVIPGKLSRVTRKHSIINHKKPTMKYKDCNMVMARIISQYFLSRDT